MARRPSRALLGVLALLALVLTALTVTPAQASDPARDRSCGWILEPSADRENILFPDLATRYLGAAIPVPPGGSIELTGEFPHARYMSLQTYSLGLQTASNLRDDEIEPDPGSVNPFRVGTDRTATRRSYTVRVVNGRPPATNRPPNTLYNNSADGTRYGIAIAYRIYLPDRGAGAFGAVAAPAITLVLANGTRIPLPTCPDPVPDLMPVTDLLAGLGLALPLPPLGLLAPRTPHFMRYVNVVQTYATDVTENGFTSGTLTPAVARLTSRLPAGLGENVDNKYVYAYLSSEWGKVVLLKGKMPTTPRTYDGQAVTTGGEQMRYWSLCTANRTTQTYGCANDEDVQVDENGYFTVAISTAANRPRNATAACGVSWLPWGIDPKGIAYLRNMLPRPDFGHAVQDAAYGSERQTLGDYYPVGRYFATPKAFEQEIGCHPAP
ncbi:hypothetical protein EFK50_09085 [Nocardioides marmoriginsengisoli]|uniref:Secreted protein n=1 Tax=Nocardioides marmoriginsengisoli TaxID=661483 RepID=A0A3N0CEU0_9ACTN|nr:hypothetical protein [Nocardioides marmoriginsengisoli]RNL61974.1 hypothetical protein EFK50_09085 [Nocardioides marmoriginsengisoli]